MAKTVSKKKKENITSIQISRETKKMLDDLGKKGETYEEIILRLIEHYK